MYLPESLSVRSGRLFMEDCDLAKLAEEAGTPCFAISEAQLRANVARYQSAFRAAWPHGEFKLMPAFKACPLLAVRRLLSELDCGCDTFGPGELQGALAGGVAPGDISVNGSIKDETLLRQAIAAGTRIVLDSPRELELTSNIADELDTTARVLFRLKPYLADLDANSDFVPDMGIRELTQIIKYGIPASELAAMGPASLEMPSVEPFGIHVHMGRHSKTPEVWRSWVYHCVRGLRALSDSMDGWAPQIIDLGGGLPSFPDRDTDVAVTGYEAPPLEAMAAEIGSTLASALVEFGFDAHGVRLEVEPGRGLHADTGVHLTRICNIKHESENLPRTWLELDTSEVFLGVPSINETPPFDFLLAEHADAAATDTVDMVGKTCNAEMLYLQVDTPPASVGDTVVLLHTGSYAEPMAANFNALPRPGTVLVSGAGHDMIKRHESIEEVYGRDQLPARFSRADD